MRLGLVLDNLQIQNISDDVGYLTSVGLVRGARFVVTLQSAKCELVRRRPSRRPRIR